MKAYKNQYKINPLELCDDNGNAVETIHVLTDYIAMRNRLRQCLGDLEKVKKTGDTEQTGQIICRLIAALYGDSALEKLLAFYDNDYNALVTTVMAHIYEDIYPGLEKINADRVAMAKQIPKRRIFGK